MRNLLVQYLYVDYSIFNYECNRAGLIVTNMFSVFERILKSLSIVSSVYRVLYM